MRTRLAVAAGKTARMLARLRGGGSALPGLIVERIDPRFLGHALSNVEQVVVVSGTNGKTTTTRMLVAALRAHGKKVLTNPTGSNFTRGVISSVLEQVPANGQVEADVAVLELDEAHSLRFAAVVAPTHALLLNVARDQLDRFAEIDYTADLLRRLGSAASLAVVLNRDDSFIAQIAGDLTVAVRYFGVHPSMADRLPELQEADVRFEDAAAVPELGQDDGLLYPHETHTAGTQQFTVKFSGGDDVGPIQLRQRGLAAMINATAATTMARTLLGATFDAARTARALSRVAPPFGRGEVIDVGGRTLELVLVKNPAGFTVALGAYDSTPVATMIAINDNTADGRDVSWLYDVSFESLGDQGVSIVSGQRAYDMALRLDYDGVHTDRVVPQLEPALDAFLAAHPGQPLRIFCTYTAMMSLRRVLASRYDLSAFGEEGQE